MEHKKNDLFILYNNGNILGHLKKPAHFITIQAINFVTRNSIQVQIDIQTIDRQA